MTRRLLVLTALILPLLSCAKRSDYDYYYTPDKSVSFEHTIKAMTGSSQLDILWVIDNSRSMGPYHRDVLKNANGFVDGLVADKRLRWRMGLLSTDKINPPFVGFRAGDRLDYTMPDAATRFKTAIGRLGLSGSGYEAQYDPIIENLRKFPDFARPDAHLAIITVSDAIEQSNRTTAQFINEITGIKGNLENVLFYTFANPREWCNRTEEDPFNWVGSKLEVLLRSLKGGAFKLCDPEFGKNIADLASAIVKQVTSPRIVLKDLPIVSTLKVLHNNREIPAGKTEEGGFWEYDVRGNAIVFNDLTFAPNENESVRVVYDVDQYF